MTIEHNAEGCLLGLACGDALGRPVEFNSSEQIASEHGKVTEMLGHGTHGKPPGTITDDTELALCIAKSLVDRRGFDPTDVADRFVDWLDSGPFDIGLMTRDSLSQIRQGSPWHEAGVDIWESRPEGSNAGNGSVMRCAPYAIAFRDFEPELRHVSQQSSAITHADPRCQWGCVILNRTLANLINDEPAPLKTALIGTYLAPDELESALTQVQEAIAGDRDPEVFESELGTSGYVVDSLQAALYYGLTAESVETAISRAVNNGGDTDTIGAIAGAVAGARFGSTDIPDRWTEEIEEADQLTQLAQQLLTVRVEFPDKKYATIDDETLIFKERTIEGPTYIPAHQFQEATIGHRPQPAPHRTIQTEYHKLTAATAAMVDWERRAYAVEDDRATAYTDPQIEPGTDPALSEGALVPVPQYPFVDSFDELPKLDQKRIIRDGLAAAEAFVRAYTAFAGIRQPIAETDTETSGIGRMDPLMGATRVLVGIFGDTGRVLFRSDDIGGYNSPAKIDENIDVTTVKELITDSPTDIDEIAEIFPQLASGTGAILDYIIQLRPSNTQHTLADTSPESQLAELRDKAQTVVGELYVMYESLRRVALRHPEIEYDRWNVSAATSGGR